MKHVPKTEFATVVTSISDQVPLKCALSNTHFELESRSSFAGYELEFRPNIQRQAFLALPLFVGGSC